MKSKMLLRLLIFSLIFLLLIIAVAACTEPETVTKTATTTATATATSTETATKTATATETATIISEPFLLSMGSSFFATHPLEIANQAWIDKIEKETNGMVHITLYPAGTLVHQTTAWDEVKAGVADIAAFGASRTPGFPIAQALLTFIYGVDVDVSRQIYEELGKKFPEIGAEFAGVKVLQGRGLTCSYILSRKPIHTLDDLQGMQIQGSPSWPGLAEKMGATGVTLDFIEIYPSLQKDIIDGTMMPVDILMSLNLAEVLSYGVNMHSSPPPENFTIMNLDTWNSLPPDIQEVFEDNIPWMEAEVIDILLNADQAAIDFAKASGFEFNELSQADLDELYGYMEEISLQKVAELDAQGLPGTEIYNEVKRLKAEYTK